MEKEKFNENIEISYSGDFAAAVKTNGDYSVEKSLQLLNYMKGKGYCFIGTSTIIAYFKRIEEPNQKNTKK